MVGDNLGRIVRYRYDDQHPYDFIATGRLVQVTDALGHNVTYTYADPHNPWLLTGKTDELGKPVFTNTYDPSGRIVRQVNNTGQDITFSYEIITDTAQIVSRVGDTEAAGLHALLVTTTEDQSGRTIYTFGSDGLLRSVVEPSGATTRYARYTNTRQPTEVIDAEGRVTRFTYTGNGLLATATNADGMVTTLDHDAWGRPTRLMTYDRAFTISYVGPNISAVRDHAGREVQFTYADQAGWKGMLSAIANTGSMTTTLTYDAAGDIVKVTDALGRAVHLTYDGAGRPIMIRDAHDMVTTLRYDAADRMRSITHTADGQSRTTTFAYDAAGHLISVTDPLSQTTTLTPDDAGRVRTQRLPDGRSITFDYDAHSHVTGITPPERGRHHFSYTPYGVLSQYQPPAVESGATNTQYVFNLLEQLTQLTQPDGATTALGYDRLGRTETITHTAGTTRLTYDPASGNVATLQSPEGTLTYSYDSAHRPTTTTWSGAISGVVEHGYNAQSLVAFQRINQLAAISFAYDVDGSLTQAGALTLAYAAKDGLLEATTLGVVQDRWTYNGFSEPVAYTATANSNLLYRMVTERDALGRITSKTETIDGVAVTHSYTYDAVGQLTQVRRNGTLVAEYTYDANGNRTRLTTPNGTITAVYDAQDRLVQYGAMVYGYTANGEVQSVTVGGQTTRYGYDAFGNLQSATLPDGTQLRYVIDGQGRRVGKLVNGVVVQGFLYADDLRPLAELDGSGAVVSQFVYGSRGHVPDYLIKGGVTYRILTDQLGSPRLVVNAATGAVVQQLDYDAFGAITRDTNPGFQPFGFAGGLYDQHTKLTHFGAREYDATTGRWTRKDPLGFAAGDANLYRYVGNDPVNFIDPTGLFVDVVADVGFILYDLYRLRTDPCNFGWNLFALGLDVLGAFLPFATGLGFAARTADNLDDVADVARSCFNSFSADTPVATPDGLVPISELDVGELVLAYNEATRTTGSYTVTDVIVHTDPVILELTLDGEVLATTVEHPFFVLLRGWVPAGELRIGDAVRTADGSYGSVDALAVVHHEQPMYNLSVATAHTFFVGEGRWLVHNVRCWPGTPEEMDKFLGFPGTRIPDTPNTPGRNKVVWQPSDKVKITYEQHPYHPHAPDWHRKPHWHLDTPGASHQRYLPGDPIPGYE